MAPNKSKSETLISSDADLEYRADLERFGKLVSEEHSNGLQAGKLATKWIGEKRFHRKLNARTFALHLKQVTGVEKSRRTIADYVAAFREHEVHKDAGLEFPHLGVAHLNQLASCRGLSKADRIELARRANDQQVPARRIKSMAPSLHAESYRQSRRFSVVPVEGRVRCMDGLDLIREQKSRSIEVLILDWQWAQFDAWSQYAAFPRPATPACPETHLIDCLSLAQDRLAEHGLILLHYRPSAFLPPTIQQTIDKLGFRDAGEHIWDKRCGGFQDNSTPLMPAHEKTILLARRDVVLHSCCGGVPSVSPKWMAPSRVNSGEERLHPHQKPVELYETLIGVGTVNGLVIDAFAGSGSAGVAAARLGCPYLGAELVPEYVELANRRIALAKGRADSVERAVNRFLSGAKPNESAVIQTALKRCGLDCRQPGSEVVAA